MNKRKILTLALSLCMVAILAVGGSLAYFMDDDAVDNVFTVGNLSIVLHEQERGEVTDEEGNKTEELVDFTQNKKLYPIVGLAQGEKDEFGLPVAANYVDKVVTIENTGSEDAWVRAYFAIPSALDDGHDTYNAGLNVLHFNFGTEDGKTTYGDQWQWKNAEGQWKYFETTIEGIKYNVYFAEYYQPLGAGETTVRLLDGVYLDASFTTEGDEKDGTDTYWAFGKELTLDEAWDWNNVKCPVAVVAVQIPGFDTVADAVNEAFGEKYNPWGGEVANWFE